MLCPGSVISKPPQTHSVLPPDRRENGLRYQHFSPSWPLSNRYEVTPGHPQLLTQISSRITFSRLCFQAFASFLKDLQWRQEPRRANLGQIPDSHQPGINDLFQRAAALSRLKGSRAGSMEAPPQSRDSLNCWQSRMFPLLAFQNHRRAVCQRGPAWS